MTSTLSEFQIIKRYFESVGESDPQLVHLGIGDDCAVVDIPASQSLCFSLDTMVEGRHFPVDAAPDKVAFRALAASLSDLAAMGAKPSFFTLSLTLPSANETWLAGFSSGLKSLARRHSVKLLGGDTTKGPLTIGIQVHGLVPVGGALLRSGAKIGDILAVTGTLGDAGAALDLLSKASPTDREAYLLDYYPTARIYEGLKLARVAHSCIDISDGLLADARHIAEASGCCLCIDVDAIPMSSQLQAHAEERALQLALSAGDDYELLFSLPEERWLQLKSEDVEGVFTKIGSVKAGGAGICLLQEGQEIEVSQEGYKHFD